jgi:acetyltransferase-like isoleucine patch superfamily enzyme
MKIVKESLDQTKTFTRGEGDKLSNLNIGKIQMIKKWLDDFDVRQYTINDDLSIDALNNLDFSYDTIEFPKYIKFRKVIGDFRLKHTDISSLIGGPEIVTGSFYCINTTLDSLDGAPIEIYNDCNIYDNVNITPNEIDKFKNTSEINGNVYDSFKISHQYEDI